MLWNSWAKNSTQDSNKYNLLQWATNSFESKIQQLTVLKTLPTRCPNHGGLVDTITGHMVHDVLLTLEILLQQDCSTLNSGAEMIRPKGPNRRSRGIIRGSNIPINQPAPKHSPELFQGHLRLSFPPRKLVSTSPPTCEPHFLCELISKWK